MGEQSNGEPQGRSALRLLRDQHQDRVLTLLRTGGPTSRAELARLMGLSPSTLTNIANTLLAGGSVTEVQPRDIGRRGRGRPGALLALNSSAGAAAGVDFGHRRVRVALANMAHEVVGSVVRAHGEQTTWRRRAALAAELLERLAAAHDIVLHTVHGIGAGVVGPGDQHAARAETVAEHFDRRLGVPVLIDNNTRLAALAETKWGAAAGLRDVLYIRLSQGVGGALVLDERVFHGASGAAGEFGHICVDPAGPACWCGRRGCLESYASAPALLDAWRPGDAVSFGAFLAALHAGESRARDIARDAGRRVGVVLAGVCNAVNPDDIVIGGEVSAAGPLLDAAKAALKQHTLPITYRPLHVRTAQLGDEDGALGAIALVLHDSGGSPPPESVAI